MASQGKRSRTTRTTGWDPNSEGIGLETMAEQECALQAWVEASTAQAGLQPKLAEATLIYIGGAATFAAVVSTWVAFKNRVVPKVAKVDRKVSDDGSFENVPLGDFDLFVFRDGCVRGNVEDVSLQTCAVTREVPVKMATLDEFFEDDPADLGPTPVANLLGSCHSADSLVCDTWLGPESLRASLMDTCNLPGYSWLSGEACPENGSYGACRIAQAGDIRRVIVFYSSPEWMPEELAEQIADSEQDCLDLSGVVETAEWVSPYREAAP